MTRRQRRPPLLLALALLLLAACDAEDSGDPSADLDGDGYTAAEDCDDSDPDVHPASSEDCGDEIDNDCDTLVDSDDPDCTAR